MSMLTALRGRGAWVRVAVAAGLAGLAAAFILFPAGDSSPSTKDVALGTTASDPRGPLLTVYGVQLGSSTPGSNATVASQVKTRSCRTFPGGPLLNLASFALVMPDGKALKPTGSSFRPAADDRNCLEGTVDYDVPKDVQPRWVRSAVGGSTFRWDLAHSPPPTTSSPGSTLRAPAGSSE